MRERPVIGLDVDGVLADMAQTIVSIYNYKSICVGAPPFTKNDTYTVNDITEYDIANFIGKECFTDVAKTMEKNKACLRLPLYPGAKSVFSELSEMADVVFVTKPFLMYKDWYVERNFWINKHFGVSADDVIYTARKHLADVDILIDDCADILEDWSKFTKKPAIKVERPWNMNFRTDRVICVSSITDIPRIVKELLNGK